MILLRVHLNKSLTMVNHKRFVTDPRERAGTLNGILEWRICFPPHHPPHKGYVCGWLCLLIVLKRDIRRNVIFPENPETRPATIKDARQTLISFNIRPFQSQLPKGIPLWEEGEGEQ